MTRKPLQTNGRIEAFDSLRGMAALGVVLWHYGEHFGARPLFGLLAPFYNAGYLLVDFFFVLSGYVLARAYWTNNRRKQFVQNVRSRIARLYPLHLFTLVLVAALQQLRVAQGSPPFVYIFNDVYDFVLNLLMLNGTGLQNGYSFNGPAWSISTEFLVNVAFLIFISSGVFLRGFYVAVSGVAALALFFTADTLLKNNLIFGYLDPQLIRCLLGFGTGVLLQLAFRRGLFFEDKGHPFTRDLIGVLAISMTTWFIATQRPHASIVTYLLFILLSALVLSSTFRADHLRNLLQVRPLVFLGEISYSIYLVHFPLQLLFIEIADWFQIKVDFAKTTTMGVFFFTLIILSWTTYKFIEQPGLRAINGRGKRARLDPKLLLDR